MKTADILNRVTAAAQGAQGATAAALESLQQELRELIRSETAKAQGRGNAAATVRKMLKSCENSGRRVLGYAWKDAQGRQITLDGYRAYRLLEPLPLPELPEELQRDKIDVEKIFPSATCERLPVPLPSVQELKAFITIQRAEHGRKHIPVWDFGPNLPHVNAVYLLDLLTVMPDAVLTANAAQDAKRFTSPLHATGKAGDALILPVMVKEKAAAFDAANAAGRLKLQDAATLAGEPAPEDNTCTLAGLARLLETAAA